MRAYCAQSLCEISNRKRFINKGSSARSLWITIFDKSENEDSCDDKKLQRIVFTCLPWGCSVRLARTALTMLIVSMHLLGSASETDFQGWTCESPREEIRPQFSSDSNGSLIISHDQREGLDGWFQNHFPSMAAISIAFIYGEKSSLWECHDKVVLCASCGRTRQEKISLSTPRRNTPTRNSQSPAPNQNIQLMETPTHKAGRP